MTVTFAQLRYFLAIADVRSFTRAADVCGVAQPTLSRALRSLEDELGAPLVNRAATVALTPAGEALLPLARRMLADADSARRAVAEIVGLRRGRVRIGATPSLCIGVLADVLRDFHARHPEIRVELSESGSQPLVAGLVDGGLDVALVIVPPSGVDGALHAAPLLRERLSVASPAARPAPATRGSITIAGLARHDLVMFREGYDLRSVTLGAFASAGVPPKIAVEGGEMDAVLRMVEAGTGVAVVPDLVFAGRPRLRRTALTPALYRTVALARRSDITPTPAVTAFAETLVEHLSDGPVRDGVSTDVQVLHPHRTARELLG